MVKRANTNVPLMKPNCTALVRFDFDYSDNKDDNIYKSETLTNIELLQNFNLNFKAALN